MKINFTVIKIFVLLTLSFFVIQITSTPTTEPTGALPLLTTQYGFKGSESKIKATTENGLNLDLPIYTIGANLKENANSQAIIYAYDIGGFNGGRTRQIVDDLSYRGYFVVLPDFFRGDRLDSDPNFMTKLATMTWQKVNIDMKAVINYLKDQGFDKFIVVGACWGGWIVFEASREYKSQVTAGISYHPALNSAWMTTKTVAEYGDLIESPQMVIATKQEGIEVKPNGIVENKLKLRIGNNKVLFKSYENMNHGFVTRGDILVPDINTAFLETIGLTYKFLDDNAKASPFVINFNDFDGSFCLGIYFGLIILLAMMF